MRRFLIVVFIILIPFSAFALNTKMVLLNTLIPDQTDSYTYFIDANIDFSVGGMLQSNVKSELSVNYSSFKQKVSLDKAYIKARFGKSQITIGKTLLDYSPFFILDSSKALFYSEENLFLPLPNRWLTTYYLSLGNFSFLEATVASEISQNPTFATRYKTEIKSLSIEAALAYRPIEDDKMSLASYVGIQGAMALNWAVSSLINISPFDRNSLLISGAVFKPFSVAYSDNLTVKFESLVKPFNIKEFYLNCELSYSIGNLATLSLIAQIETFKESRIITNATFNIYQDFFIIGNVIIPLKEKFLPTVAAGFSYSF